MQTELPNQFILHKTHTHTTLNGWNWTHALHHPTSCCCYCMLCICVPQFLPLFSICYVSLAHLCCLSRFVLGCVLLHGVIIAISMINIDHLYFARAESTWYHKILIQNYTNVRKGSRKMYLITNQNGNYSNIQFFPFILYLYCKLNGTGVVFLFKLHCYSWLILFMVHQIFKASISNVWIRLPCYTVRATVPLLSVCQLNCEETPFEVSFLRFAKHMKCIIFSTWKSILPHGSVFGLLLQHKRYTMNDQHKASRHYVFENCSLFDPKQRTWMLCIFDDDNSNNKQSTLNAPKCDSKQ